MRGSLVPSGAPGGITDPLQESEESLVVRYFVCSVVHHFVVHACKAFNTEHVFWAAGVNSGGAEGDSGWGSYAPL